MRNRRMICDAAYGKTLVAISEELIMSVPRVQQVVHMGLHDIGLTLEQARKAPWVVPLRIRHRSLGLRWVHIAETPEEFVSELLREPRGRSLT